MTGFAELAVTTNFSFLRGASHGAELVQRAAELGLSAIGVADRNLQDLPTCGLRGANRCATAAFGAVGKTVRTEQNKNRTH